MIVVMQPGASPEEIEHVAQLIRDMGLKDHVIHGTDLAVVAALGDDRLKDKTAVAQAHGVDRVLDVLKPYKMAAREAKPAEEPSLVKLSETCVFGGKMTPVIAGPCSVEGEAEILDAARSVKDAGGHALRGGAFKPRTSPYAFQGLGEAGLKHLAAARDETGLPIVTEVVTPEEVDLVARYADCLQIGTRNAQNYRLLEAVGRQPRPVLYKRGMWMTLDEYLQAAEYMLSAGNPNVILCERGIRTFEKFTRNTLSLAAVAELKQRTHLPVIADPSHGTGVARLVPAMCRAAIAAGADGLAIEMHPDPEHAVTDGSQSITPEDLQAVLIECRRVAEAVGRTMAAPAELERGRADRL